MILRRLSINGKFLSAGPTGVHRVAEQLILQLALHRTELETLFAESTRLIVPRSAGSRALGGLPIEQAGALRGQLWEQLDLPRLTRFDLLLNLCNLGPMLSRQAITMIHDAQVFISPDSYPWGFGQWYRHVLPVVGHRHLRILAVSEFSAAQLARFNVAPRDRITVVHNGVDHILAHQAQHQIIQRLGLKRQGFVLALSSVQAHKNIAVLLRAFSGPELADLTLVLFGDARRQDFEAAGSEVANNVVFAGRISDGELRALLEHALCVAFPSTTEGFGLPPLEGMLVGCPAVLAPCGALPEVGGEQALFASARDPAEWVAVLRRLVDVPEFWTEYSEAGRARAAKFTWKQAGERLMSVIMDVVADAPENDG